MLLATWMGDRFNGMVAFDDRNEETRLNSSYREQDRWEWKSFGTVEDLAEMATEFHKEKYLPVDRGPHHSPRYDVIKAPKVGDKISYSFNGDTYPDGEIARISDSFRVITSTTGQRYYRWHRTGSWLYDQTWTMVSGHRNERNPSF